MTDRLHFTVDAETADETDHLISETISAYFGERMRQAMRGPIITKDTTEKIVRKVSGEVFHRTFRTEVDVEVEFLGWH